MKKKPSFMKVSLFTCFSFLIAVSLFSPVVKAEAAKGAFQGSRVCMMNDRFMGEEQIPVPVDGKTYFGCCKACVGNLTNEPKNRVARDPLTGNEVDKSEAFIYQDPNGKKNEVLYFESAENYTAYVEAMTGENMSQIPILSEAKDL